MCRLAGIGLFLLTVVPVILCYEIRITPNDCGNRYDVTSSNAKLDFNGWRYSGCELTFHSTKSEKSWICVSPKKFDIRKNVITIEYYKGKYVDHKPHAFYTKSNTQTEDYCTSESFLTVNYISRGREGDADIQLNVHVTAIKPTSIEGIKVNPSYCGAWYDVTSSNIRLDFDGFEFQGGCELTFQSNKSWICVSPTHFDIQKEHITIEYFEGSYVDYHPDASYNKYAIQTDKFCTYEKSLVIRYISQGRVGDADILLNVHVTSHNPFVHDDHTAKTVVYTIIGVIIGIIVLLSVTTVIVIVLCCKRRNASAGIVYTPPTQGAPAYTMFSPDQPLSTPGWPVQGSAANSPTPYPVGQDVGPLSEMGTNGHPCDYCYIVASKQSQRVETADREAVDTSDDTPLINIAYSD